MNPILLTPEFAMPADGWYQIAPEGEYPHPSTGLSQVLDTDACAAIAAAFAQQAAAPNFGGALIDYDHFSFDQDKPSEAAGWIMAIEHRPGSGLWARIRWTDTGEAAVRGGRYRFISPVWRREDCALIANNRIRPLRLTNAALTNSPNILGMAPLTNTARLTPEASAVIRNRIIANALQPGNDRQRKAVMAKMKSGGGKRLWTDVDAPTDPNAQARLDAAVGKAKSAASNSADAPYSDADAYRASLGLGPKGDLSPGGSRPARSSVKASDQLKPGRSSAPAGVGTTPSAAMDKTVPLEARLRALDAKVKRDFELFGHASLGSNRLDAIALAQEILGPAENHAARSAGIGTASMSAAGAVAQTYSDKLNRIVNGILSGRGLGDLLSTLPNRSPMTDDQRRAMFAKMGRGGTGYRSATAPTSPAPAAAPRSVFVRDDGLESTSPAEALYHSTSYRDHQSRIDRYQAERDRIRAELPSQPERRTFNTVDTRALQTELMRQGKPLNDITAAVRQATEQNARVKSELAGIEDALRRKGVSKARIEAELAKELERIAKEDDKALADWQKIVASTENKIAALDLRIEEERIRQTEAEEAESRRVWNAAVKEAVAEDKTRAAELAKAEADRKKAEEAEAAAAKKAQEAEAKAAKAAELDPVRENTAIKARNKAYTEAIYRGDMVLAERLAPGIDHQANAAALSKRLPSSEERTSPRNLKALAELVKTFETINPNAWPTQ